MSKLLYLDKNIKKKLKDGPLPRKDIISRILHDPDMATPKKKDSWNEAFNRLLKNGDIKLDGYLVPDDSRSQSMDFERMIFSLVKTEKFDIITPLSC